MHWYYWLIAYLAIGIGWALFVEIHSRLSVSEPTDPVVFFIITITWPVTLLTLIFTRIFR